MNRPASLVAAIFLIIIALAQLCRAIFGISITAAGFEIPVWPSAFAAIFLAALAFWLLKERRQNE
ncbi:MAG TPA: hypothetical protein DGH68_08380 [Bacteroidetes bacterium]|nr:hypothetical protein [Bacteroidota bacterium]